MSDRGNIRVLVVDDHPVVLDGLEQLGAYDPRLIVVGRAAAAELALKLANVVRPDVILLDLRMAAQAWGPIQIAIGPISFPFWIAIQRHSRAPTWKGCSNEAEGSECRRVGSPPSTIFGRIFGKLLLKVFFRCVKHR